MSVVSPCPDISVLQQLPLGKLSAEEVEKLARHCEQCPRCLAVLHSCHAQEPSIAAQPGRDAAVNAVLERLHGLRPSASSPGNSTTPSAGGDSSSDNAAARAFSSNVPSSEIPPTRIQAPEELGWLGGYRILKMLGAGGMGIVYQAEDVQLQRSIALKIMKAEVAQNPRNRERFLREARAAAKLKSDHVVTIYQVGEERQIVFLAMEFLEGTSLEEWLSQGHKPTPAQAARIGRQIALGLADAHASGLIHRDIKPDNI